MDIYNYSNITGEYVGTSQADPSPLEQGVWLIPANATEIAPPSVTGNEVAVFENGAWQKLADFRGTKYWTDSETETEINEIGVTVPANATTQAPPTENAPLYDLTEGAWVLNEARQAEALALAEAQAEKQQLNEEFEPAKLAPALKVLTEKLLSADIAAETLSETDAQAVTLLFPKWEVGVAYPLGRVMQYNSHLYEVMQAHTSQADWAPDVATTLFRRRYAPASGIADWVEWDGHNDSLHQVGSEVMHKGSHWVSNTPDNHWEPSVFGWDEVVN